MNEELFWAYCNEFYGYGPNWNSCVWTLGMEEAGVANMDHAPLRFYAWQQAPGQLALVREFCARLVQFGDGEAGQWFNGPHPHLQPTWNRLIRVLKAATGQADVDREEVRQCQLDWWGQPNTAVCDLSLFPLASNRGAWNQAYQNWLDLPCLASRAAYEDHFLPLRAAFLAERVLEHHPSLVLCYGNSVHALNYWRILALLVELGDPQAIAQALEQNELHEAVPFNAQPHQVDGHPYHHCQIHETLFVAMRHPTATVGNYYFQAVGNFIAQTGVNLPNIFH